MTVNEVKAWKERIVIPTYAVGKPDPNPMFLEKRVYQGSSGKVYPHTVIDSVSDQKSDREYEAVYLENRYLRIMFLPELGGRVQRALDKTNNYDFIYYNHVIKPALVGLCGPWISGGIEFNWPQHHRPSTFDPVQASISENADGSCTVWMGEWENMFRTRSVSAFTLYPDKAYLEIKTKLYNPNAEPRTFLWWANPAVPVNDDTQSVFPPDVHAVMDHGKRDVSSFPIATGVYYKKDYAPGTDISRYRNIPVPTSYMAYQSGYDFLGNYDHGRKAGMLHVADHHISPGKKQWTWGNGEFGRAWDRNLTDEDGPYIELMTGCFTDNQPDFSWLMPYEEKHFTQYFMPYKKIGAVHNATKDAAVNVTGTEDGCRISIYSSGLFPDSKITVYADGSVLLEKTVDLLPCEAICLDAEAGADRICVRVEDQRGGELVRYQPDRSDVIIPEPAKPIPAPQEVDTCEELFLSGMHIEQYRHATRDASAYYLEGLRRSPEDYLLNLSYGKWLIGKGSVKESRPYLQRAVSKATQKNPNPYDGEAFFQLGLACELLGDMEEAYDHYYKATWNAAWQDAAFYRLGTIDMRRGDRTAAREHFISSWLRNGRNIKTLDALAVLCRLEGNAAEAVSWADKAIGIDPHDFIALRERARVSGKDLSGHDPLSLNHNTTIEYALCYREWGRTEDAAALLLEYASRKEKPQDVYPMIWYHLYALTADRDHLTFGESASEAGCFPHRLEDMFVLQQILSDNGPCARAAYYLGNLLYDKGRYDEAAECWKRAVRENDTLAVPHRNLAIAYYNKQAKPQEALREMERAFMMSPDSSRYLFELDMMKKKMGFSSPERLSCMEDHMSLVYERDDLTLEYITCLNNLERYEEALHCLSERTFHPWEGGEGKIPAQWKRALLGLAKRSDDPARALSLLEQAAGSYPENFGEGKLPGAQENDIYYYLGRSLLALGRREQAMEAFAKASSGIAVPAQAMYYNDQPPETIYYQGLACLELGKDPDARKRFQALIDFGEEHFHDNVEIDYFAVSLPEFQILDDDLEKRNQAHCLFMQLLGFAGMGLKDQAAHTVSELVRISPQFFEEKKEIPADL